MMTSSRAPKTNDPSWTEFVCYSLTRRGRPSTPCGDPCEPRSWRDAAWRSHGWPSRQLLATLVCGAAPLTLRAAARVRLDAAPLTRMWIYLIATI